MLNVTTSGVWPFLAMLFVLGDPSVADLSPPTASSSVSSSDTDLTCTATGLYASQWWRRGSRKSGRRRRYSRETRRIGETERAVLEEELALRYRTPETDFRKAVYSCGGDLEEEDRAIHLFVHDVYYKGRTRVDGIAESNTQILSVAESFGDSVSALEGGCPEYEYGEVPTWHFLEFMSHPAVGLQPHESFVDVGSGLGRNVLLAAKFLNARRAVGIELNEALWQESCSALQSFRGAEEHEDEVEEKPHDEQHARRQEKHGIKKTCMLNTNALQLNLREFDVAYAYPFCFRPGMKRQLAYQFRHMKVGSRVVILGGHTKQAGLPEEARLHGPPGNILVHNATLRVPIENVIRESAGEAASPAQDYAQAMDTEMLVVYRVEEGQGRNKKEEGPLHPLIDPGDMLRAEKTSCCISWARARENYQ